MANFTDLRVGTAQAPFSPTVSNVNVPVTSNSASLKGMVLTPMYKYQITPAASVVSAFAAAVVSGAPATFTLAAGSGITSTTIAGRTYYDMGVTRAILATGSDVSTAAILLTVSGLDANLQQVTTTFTGPAGTAAVSSPKTMRFVGAVYAQGNSVSAIALAPADVFGLPYFVSSWGDIVSMTWTDPIASSAGFSVGVTTSPSTSATGDVRGRYAVASASDAAKKLTVYICPVDPYTVSGLFGVTQV